MAIMAIAPRAAIPRTVMAINTSISVKPRALLFLPNRYARLFIDHLLPRAAGRLSPTPDAPCGRNGYCFPLIACSALHKPLNPGGDGSAAEGVGALLAWRPASIETDHAAHLWSPGAHKGVQCIRRPGTGCPENDRT